MADGVEQLTEKEKEALRLLHAGHESKSIARELSLSVHAVNDRLRYARRKLGTSSSRTAARLLWEAEGAPHEWFVHTRLGIAPAADRHEERHGSNRRRRGWWVAAGVLPMSILIATALAFSQSGAERPIEGAGPPAVPAVAAQAEPSAALPAARNWVAIVDHGDWPASWAAAGELFRSKISATQWANAVRPVRDPLGAVRAREFRSAVRAGTMPGAPSGDYELLEFATTFENLPASIETVVMMREADGWKVAGYFIRASGS